MKWRDGSQPCFHGYIKRLTKLKRSKRGDISTVPGRSLLHGRRAKPVRMDSRKFSASEQASLRFKNLVPAHGDSHRFFIDKPLQQEMSALDHVTRVVTFGDRDVHLGWLSIRSN